MVANLSEDERIRGWWNKTKKGTFQKGHVPWNKGKKGLQVAWNKDIPRLETTKQKISESRKGFKPTKETVEKIRQTNNSKEQIDNNRKKAIQRWRNPEYVRKQIKARGLKPNKTEQFLQKVLNELAPQEYKYNNGWFILAGKVPDFVNINGKKKIIELFGCYWHTKQQARDRINLFSKYGYKTLIIWGKEIKHDLQTVKQKILKF